MIINQPLGTVLGLGFHLFSSVKEPPVNANNVANKGTLLQDKWSLYTVYIYTYSAEQSAVQKHTLYTVYITSGTHKYLYIYKTYVSALHGDSNHTLSIDTQTI